MTSDHIDDDEGLRVAQIVLSRQLVENDLIDSVELYGDAETLTTALGMMRLAEDTMIRQAMDDDGG